ncbi:MAG: precorrin-2 dehydrogenase/sirohydrochlorin ferrochelatase family protein [Desulfonatronovibrionaceae bacterium]
MRYFPVFLDLTSRTCLVVGAGRVGTRKIRTLLKSSPARILVVDPHVPRLDIPDSRGVVEHLQADFDPSHLKGCHMAFACTSDPGVNEKVLQACRRSSIWCNIAQRPDQGDFILPAVFSRQDLIIAVSTCGCSPALCAAVKKELMDIYGPEYDLLTRLLAQVRQLILPLGLPQSRNKIFFGKIVESDILNHLKAGRKAELMVLLKDILPDQTHNRIQDIVDDLL